MISKNWRLWYAGWNMNSFEEKSANKYCPFNWNCGSGMTDNKTLALQFILYLVTFFDTWASKLSHIGRQACFLAGGFFFFATTSRLAVWPIQLPEFMSPGRTWRKHDGDLLLSGSAKISHVCRLTLPYPHTPYLVHLLQGLWHFCFCPNYSSLLHIISCMWALKSQGLQKTRICFSSCLLFLKFGFPLTLSEV